MAAIPDNILSSVTRLSQRPRRADCYLQAIDLAPGENTREGQEGQAPWGQADTPIKFQFWPESLSDSKTSEWNGRPIPGGSHPIYQWTNGGERTLSFVAVFMTDTAPDESRLGGVIGPGDIEVVQSPFRQDPYNLAVNATLSGIEIGVRDVDIRAAVSWLRWFMYPYYGTGDDKRAFEPAKAILVMPNSGIGYNGTDYVTCVMTTCDLTYEAWFESGFPRVVEVNLEFKEVVQSGERVRFHDRSHMAFASNVSSYLRSNYNSGR